VTSLVQDDPVLASFFGWFNGLNPAERHFVLAAPMNKVRPLLARPSVRNVLAAPLATFTMSQALRESLIIIVIVPEGVLGGDATTLIGQVVLARLWAAIQARPGRTFATEALGPAIAGRAAAIRRASRERFGIPRAQIEEAIKERPRGGSDGPGPVGRRPK
jgi:hypothetical protein